MNGLFAFRGNEDFNPQDPRTYPERLQIRVPGPQAFYMKTHFGSFFAQDKWKLNDRLTLSLGLRYDIEVIPLQELDNPKFPDPSAYPVDKNNFAPRVGFVYSPGDHRSLVRGGYGLFYDKTHFELITGIITGGVFSDSFVPLIPANAADPGPSLGQLPTDPLLRGGPVVDRALLNQLYPPGSRIKNTGTVILDDPERRIPYTHQLSIGYERQLGATASASVDFVHAFARDLFMSREVNPGTRVDTSRTGQVIRANPAFVASVLERSNLGSTDYDALEMQLEKRFAGNYSARAAYTLSYSRGNTSANFIPQSLVQIGTDLRLDANEGPTDFDRRHNLVLSGSALVPKTGGLTVSAVARALSGLPFSLIDSNTDADRNAILFDFLPPGTYSGTGRNAITVDYDGKRNGAYGPGFFQLDLRLGYRIGIPGGRRLDAFAEVFNLTDRANFNNPVVRSWGTRGPIAG